MLNGIADRLVHCRCAGQPPRALPLSELLLDFEEAGAEPALLDGIARTVAWHGFYCGRFKGEPIAIFQPVPEEGPPAHLLILVRDGTVASMLADQPVEATIIDYDSARAQVGIELPEQVTNSAFNEIRAAAMADFLADERGEMTAPANNGTMLPPKLAATPLYLQPWR